MSKSLGRWVTLVSLTAACGSVDSGGDAGPRADADLAADASIGPDAAMTGPATVTVFDENGNRASFVDVVFQRADGEVVQKLATNGQGEATSIVNIGDQISVVRTTIDFGNLLQVVTFVGVKPGDQLRSGDARARIQPDEPYGTMHMFVVTLTGAASYSIQTGCHDDAFTDVQGLASLPLYAHCHDPAGSIPVAAFAYDANSAPMAYAVRPSVAAGGVGSFTIDGSEWRTDFASTSMSMPTTPADGGYWQPRWFIQTSGREVFQSYPAIAGNPQPGDNVNATVLYPKGLGSAFVHGFDEYDNVGDVSTYRFIGARKSAPAPASVSFASAQLLPRLSSREVAGSGDPARPLLTWSYEAPLQGVDGGVVRLDWRDDTNSRDQEWILIVPPGSTQVRLPALPESLAEWRPTADSGLSSFSVHAMFADSSALSGYDAFRQVVGWNVYHYVESAITLFGDQDATLRVSGSDR